MTDIQKLKALAIGSSPGPWYLENGMNQVRSTGDDFVCETYENEPVNSAFIAAANPAAVLELIAEIERLKASNIDQGKRIQWLGEYNTQRHVELSSENVQVVRQRLDAEKERDQLKAENEALRETAERMEKATAFVQQLSNAAGKQPSVATGYLHDILAMMSKEASHD